MTNCSNVIYLRVSTDELSYDDQLPEILNTFNLKNDDYIILEEKVSAYKEVAQAKRSEFIKLKELVEQKKVKHIYVYSLERLERNIIRMFEFFFYCEANECRIHGVLQPSLELEFDDNPVGTFSRYQQVLIFGLLGENESYMTSQRTKKAVEVNKSGTTVSYKGNKWGRSIKDMDGKAISILKGKLIGERVELLIKKYTKLKFKSYFSLIIKEIEIDFNTTLSKSYISSIKKKHIKD